MPQKIQMVKMQVGEFLLPVLIRPENGRLFFQFPFNRELMAEVKAMKGAKWHGYDEKNPKKEWSVKDCGRNQFQILHLRGKNPYEHYDKPLLDLTPNRKCLYIHQNIMFCFGATRRQCILACEMRTGKTLVAIEIMEYSDSLDWVWVGPKSSLPEMYLQFEDWKAKVTPRFMTYDRFRIDVQNDSFKIPFGIVFDESTKVKNPTTQRSQAAYGVAEAMRVANPDCFIIEMSGAPAPKSPADWWHQCEVACPGFIREGDLSKFKQRLALSKNVDSVSGGTYPEHITWFDDVRKCKTCGKLRDEHYTPATASEELSPEDHSFEPSKNEVSYLYERMKGLVLVKFRKDCMDLPETQYRVIRVEPSKSVQRAANLILKTAPRAVTALMLSRELSDGFQYREETDGTNEKCPLCMGSGISLEWFDPDNPDSSISDEAIQSGRCQEREETCTNCKGKKEILKVVRVTKEVACPKDQVLIDLLDEHEPLGRFVIGAGFKASIDRCVAIALRYQWSVIRVDGRGWVYFPGLGKDNIPATSKDMLRKFQDKTDAEKIVFIGNPGAAAHGITLTASPSLFFFSNTFNAEDRLQFAQRIQGLGQNRGATIIDVVHLDIDQYILDNLAKKIDLLHLTMGKLREVVQEKTNEPARRA